MESNTEFVNVAIRIKPVPDNESLCLQVISKEPPVLFLVDRSQTFAFDKIFTEEVSQEAIYNETVKPLVQYVKQGYNCTVFAYGQTGTGKTYTMGTNPDVRREEDYGLISRTLNHFFEYNNDDESEIELSLSFIEIYNEKVFDLLQNDNKPPLQVKGLKAQGFSQEKVFNSYEAKHFLKIGNKNRHTAGTKQNAQSSRSHAIFTIYCNVKHKELETSAKLHLVDLAGCESLKKTGNYGSTLQEGININRGLLSIGQVMAALSRNESFIPYRQSIITSILQDSLNKDNYVSLIACVSPSSEDTTETVQTIEFAQRVKKIKSNPEVNEVISQYKKDNPILFQLKSNTPFKRPFAVQTPRPCKKQKTLQTISEPNHTSRTSSSTTDQSHSPKSFSSTAASSISSTLRSSVGLDMTQQALSPVIRKYMNAMESSLMNKLGLVIESTLKRPSRRSILDNVFDKDNETTGTPRLAWNLIQNEVSKVVKSEIAQLTSTIRATSSPIGEQLNDVRKILTYDDSCSSESAAGSSVKKENEFKVPSLPTKNKSNARPPALSPIENFLPRRSVRLSMRRISRCSLNTNISNIDEVQFSIESSYSVSEGIRKLQQTLDENKENSDEYFEDSNRYSLVLRNRKSIRREETISRVASKAKSERNKPLSVMDTPAGKRLLKGNRNDSPCTSHTKEVLHAINYGKAKELEKLQTVGVKTAQQIILFREIKGKVSKLSDLRGMPGWGIKKFEKFVEQNFLKREII